MMGIALAPTFFIKRPVPPAAGVVTDSAAPAPAVPSATPAPVAPAPGAATPTAAPVAVPAETLQVTTPLARYGVSTRGAVLTSLELDKYKSSVPTSKGAPAELLRPEIPLLGLVAISGADTLHLEAAASGCI